MITEGYFDRSHQTVRCKELAVELQVHLIAGLNAGHFQGHLLIALPERPQQMAAIRVVVDFPGPDRRECRRFGGCGGNGKREAESSA